MSSICSSVSQTTRSSRSSRTSATQAVSSSARNQPGALTEWNLLQFEFDNLGRSIKEKEAQKERLINEIVALNVEQIYKTIAAQNGQHQDAQANTGGDEVGSSRAAVMTTPLADAGVRHDLREAPQSYDLPYAEEGSGAHPEAQAVMYQADVEYAVPAATTQPRTVVGYGPCQCEECVQVHGRVPTRSYEYEYTTSQVQRGDDLHEGLWDGRDHVQQGTPFTG